MPTRRSPLTLSGVSVAALAVSLLAVPTLSTSTAAPAAAATTSALPTTSTMTLWVSLKADRSSPRLLSGATLGPGNPVYIFATPPKPVRSMVFKVDGRWVQNDGTAPHDMGGTAADGSANPWFATNVLGAHQVGLNFTYTDGTSGNYFSSFTVAQLPGVYVATKPDRSDAIPLAGQAIPQNTPTYVFAVAPVPVKAVEFRLDRPVTSPATVTERLGPYDFGGTAPAGTALPWNAPAATVALGDHTLSVRYVPVTGTATTETSSFTVNPDPTVAPSASTPRWSLAYVNDFTGSTPGPEWSSYQSGSSSNPDYGKWAASHVVVRNGALNLETYIDRAIRADGRPVGGAGGLWNLTPQTYGKFDVRYRITQCGSASYVAMLWPRSERWPQDGEVNFSEAEMYDPSFTSAFVHYADAAGNHARLGPDRVTPPGGFTQYQTMGVEWTPTTLRYTVNGRYWGTTKTTAVPQTPMALVIQSQNNPVAGQPAIVDGQVCRVSIDWIATYAMR